jgi:DNA topoisomerase-6 subunit A
MGKMAISVPSIVDDLDLLSTTAEYVLVIEKGAIFEGLKDNKFWDKNNCLLVTGKGFPDRGTRRMVKRLHDEFNLPIYVLVDGDAYGFAIYGVYKHGSVSLAYQNHQLACPEAKFLGVSINDIYNYKIPKTAILQATKADVKRANDMAKNSWFNTPFWKTELELLQKKKEKVELESFAQFGWNYLADTYIPQKIKELNT